MQPDERVAKVLARFEPVEQHYDGLNGKIIQWTLEHGNTSHDPSILAFVVGPDGSVFNSLMNGQQYQAAAFAKWAAEQADAYEKQHPRTRLPFLRAKVQLPERGTDAKPTCSALEEARAAGRPVLLYFGRGHFLSDDRQGKKETKLARKFEKGTLDSKTAAKEAQGWTLLRLDLADEEHAAWAETQGVEQAPALLMYLPDAAGPRVLDRRMTGAGLAVLLKKHRPTSGE